MPSLKPSLLKKAKREKRCVKSPKSKKTTNCCLFTATYFNRLSVQPFSLPSTCLLPAACYKHEWIISHLFRLTLNKRLEKLDSFNIVMKGKMNTFFDDLRDEIYTEYVRERRLKNLFRLIAYHWRVRKMNKNTSDSTDPITFCPIETPIYVYDSKRKRRFQFEATSLIKSMTKNLYSSLYSIPEPRRPINVITNIPFTLYQLTGIYDQLLRTKYAIVDIAMYRRNGFSIERWALYMEPQLRVTAFRDELYNYHSLEGQRSLLDYIFDTIEYLKRPITNRFETLLTNAVHWFPEHPFLDRARVLCMKAQTSDIFGLNTRIIMIMPFNDWFNKALQKNALFDKVLERMAQIAAEEEESDDEMSE